MEHDDVRIPRGRLGRGYRSRRWRARGALQVVVVRELPKEVMNNPKSLTGRVILKGEVMVPVPRYIDVSLENAFLEVNRARHNLI